MEILLVDPGKKPSRREQELQDSKARSHAARVSSARLRARIRASKKGVNCTLTGKDVAVSVESSPSQSDSTLRNVTADNAFTASPLHPGFGSFRGELLDLLPRNAHTEDFRAVDYFAQITLPDIEIVNLIFNSGSMHQLLLPCLTTPVGYHAVLAMIQTTDLMQLQRKPVNSVHALQHQCRALEEVRKLLNVKENLTQHLLVAIGALATMESALGRFETYNLHVTAMLQLFREKGHLRLASGQELREMRSLYSDTLLGVSTGQPAFGHRKYDASHFEGCSVLMNVQWPQGFKDLFTRVPLISQDTAEFITNACKLGLHIPCARLKPGQTSWGARDCYDKPKYNNYLDAVPVLLEPDRPDILFEKMLVMALSLFAWCSCSNIRTPHFSLYNQLMTQLVRRLAQYGEPETTNERHCVVWMWLVAIDAWRIGDSRHGDLLPGGLAALKQFHRRFEEYRWWLCIKQLTRLFFWTGDMEDFWTRKWNRLAIEFASEETSH